MKRFIRVPEPISVDSFPDGSRVARFLTDRSSVTDLIVELSLLLFDLAAQLTLRGSSGPPLVLGKTDEEFGRVRIADDGVECQLSIRQLEMMLSFMLIYERDHVAEVDHIDLEVGSTSDKFTLVPMVKDFVAPMSGAEAEKFLGA